jgi:hypothetical protein
MVMKRKGQVAILGLMVGIFIFMVAMVFINPIKDTIDQARGTSQLDCGNSSISDSQKGTCLIVDLILPYFIVCILALAGAWITTKLIG